MNTPLAADAAADGARLTLAAGHDFVPGDLVLLPNLEGVTPPGEILKITAVDGTVVEVMRDWSGSGGGDAPAGTQVYLIGNVDPDVAEADLR